MPLTYFEFGTLAALLVFARHAPDVAVLEVGLGGRLDAVNIVDADVAVITAIDIDHATDSRATRRLLRDHAEAHAAMALSNNSGSTSHHDRKPTKYGKTSGDAISISRR